MADIQEKTARVAGKDGTSLFYRQFTPAKERFRVVISHGLGEHSGRYGHVVDALCPMGASLWIHDHRGHGRSQGRRGHINDFEDYLQDLNRIFEMVRTDRIEALPLLLLGHSMGGLIALSFVRRYPHQRVDGLIVSSPLLGIPKPPVWILNTMAHVLSWVWPTLSFKSPLDPAFISHDDTAVRAYVRSKWVHGRITARWFVRCMSEIGATVGSPDAINSPILMQIAGDDQMVSPLAALTYFDALTVADKTLFHYKELYHEIYNEKSIDRERVLEDMKRWVAARYL